MSKRLRRHLLSSTIVATLFLVADASAQDVVVTPPIGGGFVVKDASSTALFTIDANGNLAIAGLNAATPRAAPVCFDQTSGMLGPCTNGGLVGPTGPQGPTGAPGADGATGPTGAQGLIGPTGPQGGAGPAGATGNTGPTGAQGVVGPTGPQGSAGPAGATGNIGPTGAQGVAGPTGPQGSVGPAGAQGPVGPTGSLGSLHMYLKTATSTTFDTLVATCGAGIAISGGCIADPQNDLIARSFRSSDTTWTCAFSSSGGTQLRAEVYCTQ